MSKRRSTTSLLSAKHANEPLVWLTSYTAPMARILDSHVDVLLVGDSVGMVLYGMDSTLGVSLEMMIAHGKAVVNATEKACVVVDMPFGTYQASKEQAFTNAAKIMAETGCQAVKLEGGEEMAETISFLVKRAIPVIGHIGLMPQHVQALGGYGCRGKTKEEADAILKSAVAIEKAGVSAFVLEGVTEPLAKKITEKVSVPVIGIGASPACDGQVLVTEDMTGMFTDFTPRFVKQYAHLAKEIEYAAFSYAKDVRDRAFPEEEHCVKP